LDFSVGDVTIQNTPAIGVGIVMLVNPRSGNPVHLQSTRRLALPAHGDSELDCAGRACLAKEVALFA
jgi:hypothetical protein